VNRICVIPSFLLLAGCGLFATEVKESDKQLNSQNIGAGRFIVQTASDPDVRQAGKDVSDNATTLEKNVIGKPEVSKPYTPENSKKSRDDSNQDHGMSWWQGALIGVGSILATVLGQGWLAGLLPTLFGSKVGGVATAAVEGITRVRQKIQESGGSMAFDEKTFLAIIQEAQKDDRVKGILSALAHKAEEKLAKRM